MFKRFKRDTKQIFSIRKFKAYGASSALLVTLFFATGAQAEEVANQSSPSDSDGASATETSSSSGAVETDSLIISETPETPEASSASAEAEVDPAASTVAEATTTATETTEQEKPAAETPVKRSAIISYTVQYVSKAIGKVVHSVVKTKVVETTEAVATATVNENGAELVNDSQLENYYVPDGLPTARTAEITEGATNVITYEVEGFGDATAREVAISYRVDYVDATTKEVLYSENKTHTVLAESDQAEAVITEEATALTTVTKLDNYRLPVNAAKLLTQTIKTQQENVLVFVVESNDTAKSRRTRKVESSVSEDKPYLTIENFTDYPSSDESTSLGNDRPIYKDNGSNQVVPLVFKIGFSRIEADQLELTDDAKTLGLSLDATSGYIRGDINLSSKQPKIYNVGFKSKLDSEVEVSIPITIEKIPVYGFFLYDDADSPYSTNYFYTGGNSWERLRNDSTSSYEKDDNPVKVTMEIERSLDKSDFLPTKKTTFDYNIQLTTTPFGYYVRPTQKVSDATKDTQKYLTTVPIFAGLDSHKTFNDDRLALQITDFKVLSASEDVKVELLDIRSTENLPQSYYSDRASTVAVLSSGYNTTTLDKPYIYSEDKPIYYLHFTKLPKTAGNYKATVQITDNLGVVKTFNLNLTTIERSIGGALTNADVQFEGNPDRISSFSGLVSVPSEMAKQELGKVVLNKDNAWIIEKTLPPGIALEPISSNDNGQIREAKVVKTEGQKLKPGRYSFEVKAVDGHFGDNAPVREFVFEVTDSIVKIPHQVWEEGKAHDPIPVAMENGTAISSIRIDYTPNHAVIATDGDNERLEVFATKKTDANQTARLYVTYINGDGNTSETYTDFTYEVKPGQVNDLTLEVSNANQTVKEGDSWETIAITHTEGASLRIDTTTLPKGTRFNPSDKTITGRGLYEGTYNVPVVVEKDGLVKLTLIELVVTPDRFEVEDENVTIKVLDKVDGIKFENIPQDARVTYDDNVATMLSDYGLSLTGNVITGTPTKTGGISLRANITVKGSNGLIRSDWAWLYITITGRTVSLTADNKEQRLEVDSDAFKPITLTKDLHSTLTFYADNKEVDPEVALPPGLTYNPADKTITGTPTTVGKYTFYVLAGLPLNLVESGELEPRLLPPNLSKNNQYTWERIDVTVVPVNPKFSLTNEEQTFSTVENMQPVKITADPGVTIEVQNLPVGVYYDRRTQTITGRPTDGITKQFVLDDDGIYREVLKDTYEIAVVATNSVEKGSGKLTKYVTLKLTPIAPSLQATLAEQTIDATQAITQIVLQKDAYSTLSPINLPSGLSYDEGTQTISGTPTAVGTHRITVNTNLEQKLVGANLTTATQEIVITVNPVAVNLTVTPERQTKQVLTPIDEVKIETSAGAELTVNGEKLGDYIQSIPGLTYNPDTKTISGTPTRVGTYTFTVDANYPVSGNPKTSKEVTIEVTALPVELSIADNDQTVQVNKPITPIKISHTDLSNLSIYTPGGGIIPEDEMADYLLERYGLVYDKDSNTLSGSPFSVGLIRFKLRAQHTTDNGGLKYEKYLTINVLPSDTLPTTTVPVIDPMIEGSSVVTGKGIEGATINVILPDGIQKSTTVKGGVWSIDANAPFVKGENVIVSQTRQSGAPSDHITATAVPKITQGNDDKDGKTPTVTTRPDTQDGKTGVWVIFSLDGEEITKTFIANGQDGAAGQDARQISVKSEPANVGGKSGHNIIVYYTDDNSVVSTTFVADGDKGEQGERGDKGEQGERGEKGEQGERGEKGEQGERGEKGEQGEKGETGAAGANGQDGAAGQDGTSVGISNTETLPNGDIKVTFTDGNEIIIPKGGKGDQGEKGETGSAGTNGVDGKAGISGTDGATPTVTVGTNGNWHVNGADTGIPAAGTNGANGANGSTPTVSVSDNGNWFINGSDTGIPAKGQDGVAGKNGQDGTTTANTIVIGDNGNWFINGKDTGIPATGSNGANGTNGQPGSVAINPATNTWVINGKDTGIPANGTNGLNGKDAATATIIIGTNGNWHVNGVDTGVPATGAKGERGEKGDQGETGAAGANGQDGAAGQDGTSVGISNTETLPNGDIKVIFSDGKEIVVPKGQDGRDGKDGKTPVVEAVKGADGVTTITFKDPDTGAPIGDPVKVKDGEKGADGTSVTITNTETLPSGDIKVTFSDGKEIVVPKGQDGRDGKDGKTPVVEAVKGADGVTTITFKDPDTGAPIGDPVKVKDGEKGADGTSVTITNTETLPSGDIKVIFSDGKEIVVPKGKDGRDGRDGTNGKYGRDGQPGQPGKDGRDGQTDSNHSTGTNGSVSSHDMQPLAYTSQKATVTSQTSTAQLPNTGVDNAVFLELAGYMTLLGGAMFVNKSRRKK
ncbi:putative Ig domain-containing protein [Streptococcus sp. E17BB]|uniref:putative Ig domain-containing protein n=1 Tax=Streptococcus sp. E17BB TaxID=3278714 RepID=UPI00359EB462